jgi:hypothetical protein
MRRASALLALALAACGARTGNGLDLAAESVQGDAAITAVGAGDQPTRGPSAETPVSYESPQDACLTDSRSIHGYASKDDLQSMLTGRWMLCNPGTPNAYWSGAGIGIDLLESGLAYPLFRRDSGAIFRASGYVWRYSVAPGDGTNFDLVFEGGGDPTFHTVLTDDPRKLVMDDGMNRYTFAPAQ